MTEPTTIARPPSALEKAADSTFRRLTFVMAVLAIGVVIALVVQMTITAYPAIRDYGIDFLVTDTWDPSANKFGVAPQIGGTLYSAVLGVGLGSLFGLAVAIFLTQDFIPYRFEIALKNVIELLAAIPSVVYGLWGIMVLIPMIRPVANVLHETMSGIPFFSTRLAGPGLLPAALVLAIMILPTVTAISRDSIAAVPPKLREAAFGLGATRWETIFGVILPTASRGIYGSIILGFGRAVGETMAMLFGNSNTFSWSLFAPGNTLAALLANQWPEARLAEKGPLMYAGLVLLGITLLINIVGLLILQSTNRAVDSRR
jgi:phosphate transport system permease protein